MRLTKGDQFAGPPGLVSGAPNNVRTYPRLFAQDYHVPPTGALPTWSKRHRVIVAVTALTLQAFFVLNSVVSPAQTHRLMEQINSALLPLTAPTSPCWPSRIPCLIQELPAGRDRG